MPELTLSERMKEALDDLAEWSDELNVQWIQQDSFDLNKFSKIESCIYKIRRLLEEGRKS